MGDDAGLLPRRRRLPASAGGGPGRGQRRGRAPLGRALTRAGLRRGAAARALPRRTRPQPGTHRRGRGARGGRRRCASSSTSSTAGGRAVGRKARAYRRVRLPGPQRGRRRRPAHARATCSRPSASTSRSPRRASSRPRVVQRGPRAWRRRRGGRRPCRPAVSRRPATCASGSAPACRASGSSWAAGPRRGRRRDSRAALIAAGADTVGTQLLEIARRHRQFARTQPGQPRRAPDRALEYARGVSRRLARPPRSPWSSFRSRPAAAQARADGRGPRVARHRCRARGAAAAVRSARHPAGDRDPARAIPGLMDEAMAMPFLVASTSALRGAHRPATGSPSACETCPTRSSCLDRASAPAPADSGRGARALGLARGLTVSTAQGAIRTTRSATLPMQHALQARTPVGADDDEITARSATASTRLGRRRPILSTAARPQAAVLRHPPRGDRARLDPLPLLLPRPGARWARPRQDRLAAR